MLLELWKIINLSSESVFLFSFFCFFIFVGAAVDDVVD